MTINTKEKIMGPLFALAAIGATTVVADHAINGPRPVRPPTPDPWVDLGERRFAYTCGFLDGKTDPVENADELRDTARALPLDRLMVETDAPLLAPQGHRGKRNEPAWVAKVGGVLAETLGLPLDEVARATTRNARQLFALPEEGS